MSDVFDFGHRVIKEENLTIGSVKRINGAKIMNFVSELSYKVVARLSLAIRLYCIPALLQGEGLIVTKRVLGWLFVTWRSRVWLEWRIAGARDLIALI